MSWLQIVAHEKTNCIQEDVNTQIQSWIHPSLNLMKIESRYRSNEGVSFTESLWRIISQEFFNLATFKVEKMKIIWNPHIYWPPPNIILLRTKTTSFPHLYNDIRRREIYGTNIQYNKYRS